MKILAIDDSKTMRLAIKITFATEGAEVVAVSRGSEAVARAQQMPADIVLVDHALADGEPSGYDVVRTLKGTPATAKIPVLLLVAARAPDEAAVRACGADGWIGKPFDTQELIDKVTAAKAKGATGAVAAAPVAAPARPAAPPAAAAAPAAAAPVAPAPRAAAAAPSPAAAPVAARAAAAAVPAGAATVIQAPRPVSPPKPVAPAPMGAPAAVAAAAPIKPVSAVLAPVPGVAARPAVAPAGAAAPAAVAPTAARPPSGAGVGPRPSIPIAIPIPFAAAEAPSKGMLERIAKAQGAAPGVDPKLIEGLLSLSREVVEAIVWEVVPDLAEQIVRERAAAR